MMSHPFKGMPLVPFDIISTPPPKQDRQDIHKALASLSPPRKHYGAYFSTAEAAPDMDGEGLQDFLHGYFYLKSADWNVNDPHPLKSSEASELATMPYYYIMPLQSGMRESVKAAMTSSDPNLSAAPPLSWLPDSELAVYAESWGRNGFQGGLNW
jgi:hypothetical protein